ncbi:unnamed protein product, partial [Amoebophrya sp. A120]
AEQTGPADAEDKDFASSDSESRVVETCSEDEASDEESTSDGARSRAPSSLAGRRPCSSVGGSSVAGLDWRVIEREDRERKQAALEATENPASAEEDSDEESFCRSSISSLEDESDSEKEDSPEVPTQSGLSAPCAAEPKNTVEEMLTAQKGHTLLLSGTDDVGTNCSLSLVENKSADSKLREVDDVGFSTTRFDSSDTATASVLDGKTINITSSVVAPSRLPDAAPEGDGRHEVGAETGKADAAPECDVRQENAHAEANNSSALTPCGFAATSDVAESDHLQNVDMDTASSTAKSAPLSTTEQPRLAPERPCSSS